MGGEDGGQGKEEGRKDEERDKERKSGFIFIHSFLQKLSVDPFLPARSNSRHLG